MKLPTQWHRYFGWEVCWTRWGVGLELSLGHWWPREWSAHLIVGPLMLWGGIEDCDDLCLQHNHFRGPAKAPRSPQE